MAIATLLEQMAAWVADAGPPPYPLADGAHDHAVALAVDEALARGTAVTTEPRALGRLTREPAGGHRRCFDARQCPGRSIVGGSAVAASPRAAFSWNCVR